MKHIAFLTLSMSRGGAERVIASMCNEYLVDRYRITIITCMKRPLEYDLDSRIQVKTLDDAETEAKQNMAVRFLRRRTKLSKILGEITPDILLCFLPEPNMIACSLKLSKGFRNSLRFPVIISVRNDPVREYKSKVRHLMMTTLYPKADGYVFQTDDAKRYFDFSTHIKETATVIPNPLSRNFITGDKATERDKRVVSVGSLSRQKNQRFLIEAFAQVHKDFPDYTLEIFGEGSLREELQTLIHDKNLDNVVTLKGSVPNVKDQIRTASIFVMTSDYEGMPNALMEAMAIGLPVISTDCPCGGPKFLIEDGVNGKLVPTMQNEYVCNDCGKGEKHINKEVQENIENQQDDLNHLNREVSTLVDAMEQLIKDRKLAESMATEAMKVRQKLHPDIINQEWERYINIFC